MGLYRGLLLVAGLASVASMGDGAMQVKVDRYRYLDPMFECVRVVLAQRGETYAPAYIQGISGMAFRIAGPCPCAPTCSTAMSPADLVRRLGYQAEELSLAEVPKDQLDGAVAATVAKIKAEIRAGRAVIVWHAFTNAGFDVVSGFDEEKKTFLGYGSYKGNGQGPAQEAEVRFGTCRDICPVIGAILVGQKTGEFDACAAELAALTEAVRHARFSRDRLADELTGVMPPWRFRSGLACYDFWIRQYALNPRKVPDGGGDHYPLNVYASTRRAAPEFLRAIASKYPTGEQELLAAATCFEQEGAALAKVREVFGGWGPTRWKEPDPAKAERTVTLLTEARDHYAQGIEHVAQALRAIDPAGAEQAYTHGRVRREGGTVRIEGLPGRLAFHEGHDTTWCGALEQALLVTEHPYSYSDLMGLSGLAFRTRYSNGQTKTGFCPSAAVGEMPDTLAAVSRHTGWQLNCEMQAPQGALDAVRGRIVAAIDAGRPMLCYPPDWNVGLIYGYEDEGRTLLVSDYASKEYPHRVPLAEMGPLRQTADVWTRPMPMGNALRDVLAQAVADWRRGKHDGGLPERQYWYGKAAFAAWIGDLQNYDTLTEADREGLRRIDGWIYHCLWDARKAAECFLRDWSLATPGMRPELLQIADLYKGEVALLAPLVDAKYAGGKQESYLSPEERKREIAILQQVRDLEEQAIVAITAVLKANP